jgi:hypothetical protein
LRVRADIARRLERVLRVERGSLFSSDPDNLPDTTGSGADIVVAA